MGTLTSLLFFVQFLLGLGFCNDLKIGKVEFIQDSKLSWYATIDGLLYEVQNSSQFELVKGKAIIEYSIDKWSILISNLILPHIEEEDSKDNEPIDASSAEPFSQSRSSASSSNTEYNGSKILDRTITIVAFRVQKRNDESGCIGVETSMEILTRYNYFLRLLTSGRTEVNFENSVISSVCCPCPHATCYADLTSTSLINHVMQTCFLQDSRLTRNYHSRVFFNSYYLPNLAGLATVGDSSSWAMQTYAHWALVMHDHNHADAADLEYMAAVMIHEVGHNMGYRHATTMDPKYNFLSDFNTRDGYEDKGSIMGDGMFWGCIPPPGQNFYVFSVKNVEPFYYRLAKAGSTERYRLFAWDHPYSRPFLGITKPRFEENAMIEGIHYSHNAVTIEIPWNRANMCSTVSEFYTYGSMYLEFRYFNKNLFGAGNKGIRLILGRMDPSSPAQSMLLHAKADQLPSGTMDGEMFPGKLWVAPDADRGTVAVRIISIHNLSDGPSTPDMLDREPQPLDSIPHMIVDVTYMPNVPRVQPKVPLFPPILHTSSNMMCEHSENGWDYVCKMNGDHFWWYFEQRLYRSSTRIYEYSYTRLFGSAWTSITSVPGINILGYRYHYGDEETSCITVLGSTLTSSGTISFFHNAIGYQKAKGQPDSSLSEIGRGDFLVSTGMNYQVDTDELLVTDSYNGRSSNVTIIQNNGVVIMIPPCVVQSVQYGHVTMKRNNEMKFGKIFYRQCTNNVDNTRLAYELPYPQTDMGEEMIVSPAVIVPSMFMYPSPMYPRQMSANEWIIIGFSGDTVYPFVYFDFVGSFVSGSVFTIDHDQGLFVLDVSPLAGISDPTIKITTASLDKAGSFAHSINKIRVSSAITLVGVRFGLNRKYGSWGSSQSSGKANVDIGTTTYQFQYVGTAPFVFESFERSVYGTKYKFSSMDTEVKVKMQVMMNYALIIWIVVAVVVIVIVVIVVVMVVCKMRRSPHSKRTLPRVNTVPPPLPSRKQQKGSQPASGVSVIQMEPAPSSAPTQPNVNSKPARPEKPKHMQANISNGNSPVSAMDDKPKPHRSPPPLPSNTRLTKNANLNTGENDSGAKKSKSPPPLPPSAKKPR